MEFPVFPLVPSASCPFSGPHKELCSLLFITSGVYPCWEDPPEPSLFQAEQHKWSQLFLMWQIPQSFNQHLILQTFPTPKHPWVFLVLSRRKGSNVSSLLCFQAFCILRKTVSLSFISHFDVESIGLKTCLCVNGHGRNGVVVRKYPP